MATLLTHVMQGLGAQDYLGLYSLRLYGVIFLSVLLIFLNHDLMNLGSNLGKIGKMIDQVYCVDMGTIKHGLPG